MEEYYSKLHLPTASNNAERQNPRKVSVGLNREPLIGKSQNPPAVVEVFPLKKADDITCGMNSRQPRRSHFDKHLVSGQEGIRLASDSLELVLSKFKQSRFNPIAYHLEQIEWAVFGTITFKDVAYTHATSFSEDLRKEVCRRLIGKACSNLKIRHRRLLYYGKTEWGVGMRGHYNFLIGMDGIQPATPITLASEMQQLWVGGLYPQGTAVIEPFRQELHQNGIRYQSKYEYGAKGDLLNNPELFSYLLWKRMNENAQRN